MEINDPRIDAYLNGDLLQEEIAAFETEAKQSPETWEHIQFQQFMIEGIRREGAAELSHTLLRTRRGEPLTISSEG